MDKKEETILYSLVIGFLLSWGLSYFLIILFGWMWWILGTAIFGFIAYNGICAITNLLQGDDDE